MQNKNFNSIIKKRKASFAIIIGIVLAVIAAFWGVAVKFYGDFLEIKEIGSQYISVYMTNISTEISAFLIAFLVVLVIISLQLARARKVLFSENVKSSFINKNYIFVLLSFGVAFFTALTLSDTIASDFLLMKNSTSFNIVDPVFYKDISYYVFTRPFVQLVANWFMGIWLIVTLVVALVYFMLYIRFGETTVIDLVNNSKISKHIVFNVVVYILLNAFCMWLSSQGILFNEFAGLTGAGFVLKNIKLNYFKVAPVVAVVLVVLVIWFLKKKDFKKAIYSFLSYFAIMLLVEILAVATQVIYVSPNEVKVEEKYIANNIKYTKMAYNIDDVYETDYEISNSVDKAQEEYARSTIDNIRIIGLDETLVATNQLQGLRNYYKFKDLDIGIYNINGTKKAVAVGVRELDNENLDSSAKNYINEKFRYTHGFGAVMSSINTVSAQGEPDYYIKDMVQNKKNGIPYITQPRIYFGEIAEDNVIVNTNIKEIDYSEGTKDHEFKYDGKAGIKLDFVNRLLMAMRNADFRMLVSNQITPESKILTNRNITERVKKIAPFLKYDVDPQPIISEAGRIVWVIDAYTCTDKFPYAQYTDGYNYIRNSVKVTVDAYDGIVKFYIIDRTDPIVLTYSKIYPNLFEKNDFPKELAEKIMYPEYLFNVQCRMYAQYHTTSPSTFYNKSDMYAIANEKYDEDIKSMVPYYNLVRLKEFGDEAQFIGMLPYTLYNRENMVSWIAVGNEGDNYGKLVCYKFPKNYNIYGPLQIENIIDNDSEISKELTLWNSGGTNVLRGNLLVIPIFKGLLYIEPVYLSSNNQASLPQLKRIIAVFGDNVAMEETVEKALSKVLLGSVNSGDTVYEEVELPDEIEGNSEYGQKLSDAYKNLEESAKEGKWESFGKSLDELKKIIDEMNKNKE